MISDNVEFLRYCGGHFENGKRLKFFNDTNTRRDHRGLDRMVVKSPKQSLEDLLFLLRFLLLFSLFSFLSLAHELVHAFRSYQH
jgi:hypothetical protein